MIRFTKKLLRFLQTMILKFIFCIIGERKKREKKKMINNQIKFFQYNGEKDNKSILDSMREDLKKLGIVTVVTEVGTVNIVSENNKAVFLTPALYQRMMLDHDKKVLRLADQILYQYDCLNKGIKEVREGVSDLHNKVDVLQHENREIKEQLIETKEHLTRNNKELDEIKQMMVLMLRNQMSEKQQSNSFTSFVER